MGTVRLEDLVADPACPLRPRMTTAHQQCERFYRRHLRQNHRRPSILEQLRRAPSRFAVEGLIDDFERFVVGGVPARKRAQVHEAARVRIAILAGDIP